MMEVILVTLANLKYALYLNNLELLAIIKGIQDIATGDVGAVYNALLGHTNNAVIHVTQEDKDTWNAILDNAKAYAKELFDTVTSFRVEIVTELPTEDIKELCIYLLTVNPEDKDYYEEYMYINGQWEVIGSTRIDLTPYILRTEVEELLKEYTKTAELTKILSGYLLKEDSHKHENMNILNDLSDVDGLLNYRGTPVHPIVTDIQIQQAITDTLKILKEGGTQNDT